MVITSGSSCWSKRLTCWAQSEADCNTQAFAWPIAQVLAHARNPQTLNFAYVINEQLAAMVLGKSIVDIYDIDYLYTSQRFRRQGCMRALLKQIILEQPAQEIWLEVHVANTAAQRLYKSLGFALVGTRPGYYADGGACYCYGIKNHCNFDGLLG